MVGLVVGWRIDTRAVQVQSRERPYGFRGQATGVGCGFGCGRGGMGVHWISSYRAVEWDLICKFFANEDFFSGPQLYAAHRAVCASAGHGRAHHVHQPRAGRRPAHPGRPELLRLHRWVVEDAPSDGFCSTITTGGVVPPPSTDCDFQHQGCHEGGSLRMSDAVQVPLQKALAGPNTKAVMKVGR